MPFFEGCCPNTPTRRKKSTAYAPPTFRTGKKQSSYSPTSPSTSGHQSSTRGNNGCHMISREMNGNGKNQSVRFHEGLLTGSTEMLNVTKFYQNCVDRDTESHWIEVYKEQKAGGGQTASSSSSISAENGYGNISAIPKDKLLIARSTTTMHEPQTDNNISSTSLEKTLSAEPKADRKFKANLQRCQEMENIDKVATDQV